MKRKKTNKKLEYRMYGLVPYNISPIQQGIQFGHAVVEYGISKYGKLQDYLDWAKRDKTFIILNGGTTCMGTWGAKKGSLNEHWETLSKNYIKCATFWEPDLGEQLTAIVFLVDERVWDKEKYPKPVESVDRYEWMEEIPKKELDKILFLDIFLKQFRFA